MPTYTDIPYTNSTNPNQSLDIYITPNNKPTTKCIVYIHGGLWKDKDKLLYNNVAINLSQNYSYNVFVLNYRVIRDDTVQWPTFQYDIVYALRFIQQNQYTYNYVFNHNIYVIGHSCGATMSLLLSTTLQYIPSDITIEQYKRCIEHIAGIIGVQGIYDYKQYYIDYPTWSSALDDPLSKDQSIWPQPVHDCIELHNKNEKLYIDAPILLVHSKEDSYVPESQVQSMYDALHQLINDKVQLNVDVTGDHYIAVDALGIKDSPITQAVHKFIQSHKP